MGGGHDGEIGGVYPSISIEEDIMARILVVDDEPSAVELLTEFLTGKNHTVIGAVNGEEALRKVKEERPHLIFLDVMMPKMSGLEVLKKIREIDKEVGVIMVTAVHEEETGRQALKLGAFDFITKPIDLAYLETSLWHKLALMTL
jgi:two-component system, NtrC family, response regulator AtoC